jgi:hypothetical protein
MTIVRGLQKQALGDNLLILASVRKSNIIERLGSMNIQTFQFPKSGINAGSIPVVKYNFQRF